MNSTNELLAKLSSPAGLRQHLGEMTAQELRTAQAAVCYTLAATEAVGAQATPRGWRAIDNAPKDGTVIGVWSAKEPGVIRLVRWGVKGMKTPVGCWVTTSKGCAVLNVPTLWFELPAPPLPMPGEPE